MFRARVYVQLVVQGSFFFQAEDGIRDLVRSRGLGDVYKRQMVFSPMPVTVITFAPLEPTTEAAPATTRFSIEMSLSLIHI